MTYIALLSWFSLASPHAVVERAIDAHGSAALRDAEVHFTFRGARVSMARRPSGLFEHRVVIRLPDGSPPFEIVLSNDGVYRSTGGKRSAATAADYETLNSVVYFASMPLPLLDPAVILHDAGTESIEDERLHRVRVTFREEGGGKDHEDEFVFWFRESDGTMAYLAYRYATSGGGIRFRVSKNPRVIRGVHFLDFDNYETKKLDTPLTDLAKMHRRAELEKVSEILTEDICFSRLGDQVFQGCP